MMNYRKRRIIARYLANQCSPKEKAFVEKKLLKNEKFKRQVIEAGKIWELEHELPAFTSTEQTWLKLQTYIRTENNAKQRKIWSWENLEKLLYPSFLKPALRIAVVLILVVGGLFMFKDTVFTDKPHQPEYTTITVDNGKKRIVEFRDGTMISLDAGSSITYPNVFKGTREIWLNGEAYFEVAHNKTKPFIVHADEAIVKVLGTKFNVRSWEESESITVAVTEGKVKLSREGEETNNSVVIPKGMMSYLPKKGNPTKPIKGNVAQHIAWLNNEIIMNNVSLREVLMQLERWYKFEFKVSDKSIYELDVSVHIRNTSIPDILDLISTITDTEITRNESVIEISYKH